jgi:hypothetical protein
MGLAWLAVKAGERNPRVTKLLTILIFPISLSVQLFCTLPRVSWVIGKTFTVIDSPSVKYTWLYWIVTFFIAPALYQFRASKEKQMDIADEGVPNRRKEAGATFGILAAITIFFIIALYPSLMAIFYDRVMGLTPETAN